MPNHPNRGNKSNSSNPTPEKIRSVRESVDLTQTQAAELVHASLRSWQQWEAEEGAPSHRRMHPAFWELFLIKTKRKKK